MKKIFYVFIVLLELFLGTKAVAQDQILTLQPGAEGKDTYVHEFNKTTSYPVDNKLAVMAWTFSSVPSRTRALIEFDVSSIPQTATVKSATLYLYHSLDISNPQHSTLSGSNEGVLRRVTTAWEENTVNWNNQPSTTSVGEIMIPASSSPTEDYTLDITLMVSDMVKDPSKNFGFMLTLITEEYYRTLMFASSDEANAALRPKLVVTYSAPPAIATVPDDNFKNFLKTAFPNAMDSESNLLIDEAKIITKIVCPKCGIKSIAGIENFKNLDTLDLRGNELSDLPQISQLTKLKHLDVAGNKLGHFPDLSALTNLKTLGCESNKITRFPNLGNNSQVENILASNNRIRTISNLARLTKLKALDISNNQVQVLPDLSKNLSLQYLNVGKNNLTQLPVLSANTELESLIFYQNLNVSNIPDLSNNVKLKELVCFGNSLTSIPDLSNNANLVTLICYSNSIESLPDLSKHQELITLSCANNRLSTLPEFTFCEKLRDLDCSNNEITIIPDLTNTSIGKISQSRLILDNNKLTFQDLVPLKDRIYQEFTYLNQKVFSEDVHIKFVPNQKLVVDLQVDSYISSNTYDWYKDTVFLISTKSNQFVIEKLQLKDTGSYSCKVKNTDFPDLVLSSGRTSVSPLSYETIVLQPGSEGKDSYINDRLPNNNFGNDSKIAAMAWESSGEYSITRGLLQFDLTSIPTDAIVTSAELHLYHSIDPLSPQHTTTSGGNSSVLQRVTSPWLEETVNWTNAPSVNTLEQIILPASTNPTEDYIIDVRSTIEDMVMNPETNFGFMLRLETEGYFRAMMFASSDVTDAALRPKLVVKIIRKEECQEISLRKGWNLVSSYVKVSDPRMSSIFKGLQQVIVKNAQGKILYAPQYSIYGGIWNIMEGYMVYSSVDQNLTLCGSKIDPQTSINLPKTTYPHYIPYLGKVESSIRTAVSSLGKNFSYIQCMAYSSGSPDANAFTYIPDHEKGAVDQIGTMKPGLAYKVFLRESIPSFIYPKGTVLRVDGSSRKMVQSVHFSVFNGDKESNSIIAIPTDAFDVPVMEGDEIAVFYKGKTIGVGVFQQENMAITVWKLDEMKEGDPLVYKYWNAENNKEYELEIQFDRGDGNYRTNALSIASTVSFSKQPLLTDNDMLSVFPNPSVGNTVVAFLLKDNGLVEISVYDIYGREVKQLLKESFEKGTYRKAFDLSSLPAGQYICKVWIGNKLITKKLIINRN